MSSTVAAAPPPAFRYRPAVRQFVLPKVPAPAPRDTGIDIWTTGGTDALVVGDVVLITEGAEVPDVVDGQRAYKASGRAAPARVEGKTIRMRTLRRTLATVIAVGERPQGRRGPTRTLILDVMMSQAPGRPHVALPVGRRWTLFQMSVNKQTLPKRVERLRGSGPKERNDEAGRQMLLDRLLAAAGAEPVEALRRCVDPLGRGPDGVLQTVGAGMAAQVVAGEAPVRMWMLSQPEGMTPTPDALDYDEVQAAQMDSMDIVDDYDLADD